MNAQANQNTACIQVLRDQLDTALSKIDDLENRSRHYNFRIRGLPESVLDIQGSVKLFIPDIPNHRLEQDPNPLAKMGCRGTL